MIETDWKFWLAKAEAQLPDNPATFKFRHGLRRGSMKVGLYAPHDAYTQGPHQQDELCIAVSGIGDFVKGEERRRFAAQDVIFVEAGAIHRFENFSPDFATWVTFWGPSGDTSARRCVDRSRMISIRAGRVGQPILNPPRLTMDGMRVARPWPAHVTG